MKPLFKNFAVLSVEAKQAENRVTEAQADRTQPTDALREKVCQEAEQALHAVEQRVGQVGEESRTRFEPLHAKLIADFDRLRAQTREMKGKVEQWQAGNYADDRELDALAAIDYAIATTKLAELQTLDAISARSAATEKSGAVMRDQPIIA